jgi:hypothetical protein
MVKFSSNSPQDRLALISASINDSITADQRSVSDTPIFCAFMRLFPQELAYVNDQCLRHQILSESLFIFLAVVI